MQLSTSFDVIECLVSILELVGADKLGEFFGLLSKLNESNETNEKVAIAEKLLCYLVKHEEGIEALSSQHDEILALVRGFRGETEIQDELQSKYRSGNGNVSKALMIARILDCFDK